MAVRMRAFALGLGLAITLVISASPARAEVDGGPPDSAGVSGADIDKWFNADVMPPKG
jgi:hypothetical protein